VAILVSNQEFGYVTCFVISITSAIQYEIFLGPKDCLSLLSCIFLNSGSLNGLQTYETERQRHNVTIQSGIEFLHRLYSFDYSPIVALRSMGLSLVNSSDTLKVGYSLAT